MILMAAALLALAFAQGASPTPDEAELLGLVNEERTSRQLAPLAWDPALATLARLHAADMRAAGRISHHSTKDGADFTARLARTDYRAGAAAENVAVAAGVARAHQGLMSSPGHRANILNRGLTAVGIGIVMGSGSIFVVEDFAAPLESLTPREAAARVGKALRKARRGAGASPFAEDAELSRRLSPVVDRIVEADSVRVSEQPDYGPGWIFAYTSMDPSELPRGAASKAARARGYGLALDFRKTRAYPFGTWWIVLALKGSP